MPLRALFLLAVVTALPAFAADTPDAVIVAAMRLSDEPNYRWVTTVVDDARTYEIHGATVKGGYTHVKMPMVNKVRRRLGRSATDTDIEAFFKGNVRCVLETDEGWKTVAELPPPLEPSSVDPAPIGSLIGLPPPRPKLKTPEGYSNLQLAISHPHEDLGVIVTSHTDLRFVDDTVTGSLSTLGAQLLLVHDGQEEITPLEANGTFKLWIRGGIVTRYQVQLDGILSVGGFGARKQVRVRQTSDTLLDDIGRTKVEVPLEARKKLDA